MARRNVLTLALILQAGVLGFVGSTPQAEAARRHGRPSRLEKRVVEAVNLLRGVDRLAPDAQARVLEQFHGDVAQLAAGLPAKARGHNQIALAARIQQARTRHDHVALRTIPALRKAYLVAHALVQGVLDVQSGLPYEERQVKALERKVRRAHPKDLATLDYLRAKVRETARRQLEAFEAAADAGGPDADLDGLWRRLDAEFAVPQIDAARTAYDQMLLRTLPDYASFRSEEEQVRRARSEHEGRNATQGVLKTLMGDPSFAW